MSKGRGQVRVAGTCAAGHVTRTVSDPGRNTWQGTCAHDGCELKVNARRIPAERVPEASVEGDKPAPPDPYQIVEVDYDAPAPARKRRPAARADAEGDPVSQPPAGSPVGPLPAAGPGDGADDDGTDGRPRRWTDRLRRNAGDRGPLEFRTPFDD